VCDNQYEIHYGIAIANAYVAEEVEEARILAQNVVHSNDN